jgi:hypothetical protein
MHFRPWTIATLALIACIPVWAQTDAPASPTPDATQTTPAPAKEDKRWRYVIGVRASGGVSPDDISSRRVRPEIGLSYGRWRLGFNADQERWVGARSRGGSSAIGYSLPARGNISADLSLRLKNLSGNDGSSSLVSPGRRALILQGRLSMPLVDPWTASLSATQDISDKGDGTTLALGVSRAWVLSPQSSLSWGTALTWGTGEHWRTPYELQRNPPAGYQQIGNGLGSLSSGLTYRQSLTKNWAWFVGGSVYQNQGDLRRFSGSGVGWTAQTGLLWFGEF